MERLEGSATVPVTWAELDAHYALKLPTLFHPCLDVLTPAITGAFDLFGMGRRGIAPITAYLEIGARGDAIALGRPLEVRYTVALFRAHLPPNRPSGAPRERLLLDQRAALWAFRSAGAATELGFDDGSGEALEAGDFRLVQVFTRPFAPPGERQVTEVPPEFAALREQRYDGPPPGVDETAPAHLPALGEVALGRTWGRSHTDINHHVTVAEHLRLLDTAFVTGLAEAAHPHLPVARHRTARIACAFRRPFFPGDACVARARLFGADGRTVLQGGTQRRQADGTPEEQPSIAARLEGVIEAGE